MLDNVTRPKAAHVWAKHPDDWYVEPVRVTRDLLAHEHFVGLTWDPACGQGNVCEALTAAGMPVVGTDIVRRREGHDPWWQGQRDFLADNVWLLGAVNVITNPPFRRARGTEAFIRKALKHARGKIAVFAELNFLSSSNRAQGLWKQHPPHRVWIVADRPSCPPGEFLAAGKKASGGRVDWCWLIWDLTAPPGEPPTLRWIRPTRSSPSTPPSHASGS